MLSLPEDAGVTNLAWIFNKSEIQTVSKSRSLNSYEDSDTEMVTILHISINVWHEWWTGLFFKGATIV